jgi:hypothetical protein
MKEFILGTLMLVVFFGGIHLIGGALEGLMGGAL